MSGLSSYTQLIVEAGDAIRGFETSPAFLEATRKGMSLARYRLLLRELHCVARDTKEVCGAIASRIGKSQHQLQAYLQSHIEEIGHDQRIIDDLELLGAPSEEREDPQLHPTLAIVGYIRSLAAGRSPAGVLGIVYCLEMLASVQGGQLAGAFVQRHGSQLGAGTSFLISHSSLHSEHLSELREVINTISDVASRNAIAQAARLAFSLLSLLMEAIWEARPDDDQPLDRTSAVDAATGGDWALPSMNWSASHEGAVLVLRGTGVLTFRAQQEIRALLARIEPKSSSVIIDLRATLVALTDEDWRSLTSAALVEPTKVGVPIAYVVSAAMETQANAYAAELMTFGLQRLVFTSLERALGWARWWDINCVGPRQEQ